MKNKYNLEEFTAYIEEFGENPIKTIYAITTGTIEVIRMHINNDAETIQRLKLSSIGDKENAKKHPSDPFIKLYGFVIKYGKFIEQNLGEEKMSLVEEEKREAYYDAVGEITRRLIIKTIEELESKKTVTWADQIEAEAQAKSEDDVSTARRK